MPFDAKERCLSTFACIIPLYNGCCIMAWFHMVMVMMAALLCFNVIRTLLVTSALPVLTINSSVALPLHVTALFTELALTIFLIAGYLVNSPIIMIVYLSLLVAWDCCLLAIGIVQIADVLPDPVPTSSTRDYVVFATFVVVALVYVYFAWVAVVLRTHVKKRRREMEKDLQKFLRDLSHQRQTQAIRPSTLTSTGRKFTIPQVIIARPRSLSKLPETNKPSSNVYITKKMLTMTDSTARDSDSISQGSDSNDQSDEKEGTPRPTPIYRSEIELEATELSKRRATIRSSLMAIRSQPASAQQFATKVKSPPSKDSLSLKKGSRVKSQIAFGPLGSSRSQTVSTKASATTGSIFEPDSYRGTLSSRYSVNSSPHSTTTVNSLDAASGDSSLGPDSYRGTQSSLNSRSTSLRTSTTTDSQVVPKGHPRGKYDRQESDKPSSASPKSSVITLEALKARKLSKSRTSTRSIQRDEATEGKVPKTEESKIKDEEHTGTDSSSTSSRSKYRSVAFKESPFGEDGGKPPSRKSPKAPIPSTLSDSKNQQRKGEMSPPQLKENEVVSQPPTSLPKPLLSEPKKEKKAKESSRDIPTQTESSNESLGLGPDEPKTESKPTYQHKPSSVEPQPLKTQPVSKTEPSSTSPRSSPVHQQGRANSPPESSATQPKQIPPGDSAVKQSRGSSVNTSPPQGRSYPKPIKPLEPLPEHSSKSTTSSSPQAANAKEGKVNPPGVQTTGKSLPTDPVNEKALPANQRKTSTPRNVTLQLTGDNESTRNKSASISQEIKRPSSRRSNSLPRTKKEKERARRSVKRTAGRYDSDTSSSSSYSSESDSSSDESVSSSSSSSTTLH